MRRFCIFALIFSTWAIAQETGTVLETPISKPFSGDALGWKLGASLSGTADWKYNDQIPGQTTGHYLTLGGNVKLYANHFWEWAEWTNDLTIAESFKKTPPIDLLQKVTDRLDFTSEYAYYLWPWGGVFAMLELDAPIFSGTDINASPKTYAITNPAGGPVVTVTTTNLQLTDPFAPLDLKEYAGAFARIFNLTELVWKVRAGFLAHQIFTDGELHITNSKSNPVAVTILDNSYNFGPVVGTKLTGVLWNKWVTYETHFKAYYALILAGPNIDPNAPFDARFNWDTDVQLSFNFTSWLKLSYLARARKRPDISSNVEFQSDLLLTLNYSV